MGMGGCDGGGDGDGDTSGTAGVLTKGYTVSEWGGGEAEGRNGVRGGVGGVDGQQEVQQPLCLCAVRRRVCGWGGRQCPRGEFRALCELRRGSWGHNRALGRAKCRGGRVVAHCSHEERERFMRVSKLSPKSQDSHGHRRDW